MFNIYYFSWLRNTRSRLCNREEQAYVLSRPTVRRRVTHHRWHKTTFHRSNSTISKHPIMSDHPRLASRMLPPTAAPAAPSVPSLAPSLSDKLSADAVLATAVLQPGSSYVPWSSSTSTSPSPRPAHNPSKQNAAFGAINILTLQAVSHNQLDRFKRVVRSIPIQFPATMIPRFRGWSVTTKGDVQHFLDSQVFDIAWQVVLEMAPRETNCNFTATKQLTIEVRVLFSGFRGLSAVSLISFSSTVQCPRPNIWSPIRRCQWNETIQAVYHSGNHSPGVCY